MAAKWLGLFLLAECISGTFAAASTLSFDGKQFMRISMPDKSRTKAEDISLRFRTTHPDGLLFTTQSSSTSDTLELTLQSGQVRFIVSIGKNKKILYTGEALNDDRWHTVKIRRRARSIEIRVDNSTAAKENIGATDLTLHIDGINVGAEHHLPDSIEGKLPRLSRVVEFDHIHVAKRPRKDTLPGAPNFKGRMQQLIFNGNHFFEMAQTGDIRNIRTTAEFDQVDRTAYSPLTFTSKAAYLMVRFRLYATFQIYFQLKTTQPDGLILYSAGGKGKDFMAVELVKGHLRYVYDVGSGPKTVKSNLRHPINDNKWHDIAVLRPTLHQHILRVDSTAKFDTMPDSGSVHFDTDSEFYIGGVKSQLYNALPIPVNSREGYQGCLASIDLDGDDRSMLEQRQHIPEEYKDMIVEGCKGPDVLCSPASCANRGVCIQEWNGFNCNCDLTSFTGPTCADEGVAYRFGEDGGLITFNFPEDARPDTKRDQFALGFMTTQNDAVLLHINSHDSKDYIELELMDGNVFVVYNMGTLDLPIGELFEKVNDGQYHVVAFIRSGPNATIQVDNQAHQTKNPTEYDIKKIMEEKANMTGSQLNTFNTQSQVLVGGKRKVNGQITRPFTGVIAGLVLNSERILKVASEEDPRVTIDGDVELEISPLFPVEGVTELPPTRPVIATPDGGEAATSGMQSTMGVKVTTKGDGVTDDFVFSGVGSGCLYDDDDDCSHVGVSPTDALIKPVITVRTTLPTPSTSTSTATPASSKIPTQPSRVAEDVSDDPCDDDEDCEGSSGSGILSAGDTGRATHKSLTDVIDFEGTPKPDAHGDKSDKSKTVTSDSVEIITYYNMTETPRKIHPVDVLTSKKPSVDIPAETKQPPRGGPNGKVSGSSEENEKEKLGRHTTPLGLNIGLIVGIAAGVVLLLLILAYGFYKYKSRDEGSYKIDESKNYRYDTYNTKPASPANGGMTKSGTPTKPKKKDVKEWYV